MALLAPWVNHHLYGVNRKPLVEADYDRLHSWTGTGHQYIRDLLRMLYSNIYDGCERAPWNLLLGAVMLYSNIYDGSERVVTICLYKSLMLYSNIYNGCERYLLHRLMPE